MRNGFLALAAAILVSGCGGAPAAPAAPSKPAEPAMKPVSKPVEAPKAPAAAPIDRTPIKADVSKIKFLSESALFGWDDGESRAFFYTNGTGEVGVRIPADGEYEVVVTASCTAAKGENAKFKLHVDGAQVGSETQLKSEDAKDYVFTAPLKAGDRRIAAEFTNDLYKEGEYDLNFYLNGLKLIRNR
jgi:predicted xylan-binding protein with Ca-dependent carbohydrate-binding module